MKQSIYQKLLMSLTIVAFLAAQVLTRSQVDSRQIEAKKKIVKEKLPSKKVEAKTTNTQVVQVQPIKQLDKTKLTTNSKRAKVKEANLEQKIVRKVLEKSRVEEMPKSKSNIHTQAREINEKYIAAGSPGRVMVVEKNGKKILQRYTTKPAPKYYKIEK